MANDILGKILFSGEDDAGAKKTFADITLTQLTPAAGAEWGRLDFSTLFAGSYAQRVFILAGLYTLGATGGDKGVDTINATTLYEAGVSLAAKYAALASANTFTADMFLSRSGQEARLTTLRTDTHGDSANVASWWMYGKDDAGVDELYANIVGRGIQDVAAGPTGDILFSTVVGGSFAGRLVLQDGLYTPSASGGDKGADTINATTLYEAGTSLVAKYAGLAASNVFANDAGQVFQSTDAGGGQGPNLILDRASPSAVAGDVLGGVVFRGRDDAGTPAANDYASMIGIVTDPTAGSEDGRVLWQTTVAGAVGTRLNLAKGLWTGAASGGDRGVDTINATALYEAGTSLAAKYQSIWTQGTAQALTSGTSKTFSGIPAGVKRITVMIDQMSMSGTDTCSLQLGDSGGIEATGYESSGVTVVDAAATGGTELTTGFIINRQNVAAQAVTETIELTLFDASSNLWLCTWLGRVEAGGTAVATQGGGRKALSGELTQLKVLTSGSDTFDAGQINIMYQ